MSLLSPSLIPSAYSSTVYNDGEDSTSESNEEVETSPLMMFGEEKKYEAKKEHLSTDEKTARYRRDAEAVEQEREPYAITVSEYCEFLFKISFVKEEFLEGWDLVSEDSRSPCFNLTNH